MESLPSWGTFVFMFPTVFKWFEIVISFFGVAAEKTLKCNLYRVCHISCLFGNCPKWPTGHPYFANYRGESQARAAFQSKNYFAQTSSQVYWDYKPIIQSCWPLFYLLLSFN